MSPKPQKAGKKVREKSLKHCHQMLPLSALVRRQQLRKIPLRGRNYGQLKSS